MKIQVTADDIAHGLPCSRSLCPIARALRRSTGRWWRVSTRRAENKDGGRIELPVKARNFVDAFDSGLPVEPFAFEVPDAGTEG